MKCPNCQKWNAPTSRVCVFCGAPLPTNEKESPQEPEPGTEGPVLQQLQVWFRWIPMAFLIMAVLMPVLYTPFFYLVVLELGPKYWRWDPSGMIFSFFVLAIILIIWFRPIIGGIIAIVIAPIRFLFLQILAGMAGLKSIYEQYLILESFTLVLGGILSIVWGILCLLQQRRQRESI